MNERSNCILSEHVEWFDDILLTDHSPEQIDWPVVDEEIAGFRLKEYLGSGGFSRVFLAEDLAYPGRLVAVKFCSNETHEAKALANLTHNAIGVVYSVTPVKDRNLSAICMAFKSRTTLHRIIRKVWSNRRPARANIVWDEIAAANELDVKTEPEWSKQPLVAWVTDVAAELARGLSASHELGIIHCDMKPSNIIIDRDGRPTLVDFNVAYQKDAKSSPGNTGGTLPYMSPEQIRAFAGQGFSDVGPLTDVYGLGATMYELLTGRMPFGPAPTAEDGIRHLLEMRKIKPRPIREFNSAVDPDLERLVMSCLAYEMKERPISAKVVADELDFIRKRTLVQAMPTEWWRTRRTVGTAVAMTVLAVAALGPFGQETGNARAEVEAAVKLPDPREIAVKYIEQAYDKLEKGEAEKAVELFEKAKAQDPRHEGGQLGYIRALIASHEYQDAYDELARLRGEKSLPELDALHAYCAGLMKQFKNAVSVNEIAMERGMKTAQVKSNHAFYLSQIGKSKAALPITKEALGQMGGPSKANLVAVLVHFKSDCTARSWNDDYVFALMKDAPESAEKYNLWSLVNLAFGLKERLVKKNMDGYEEYSRLAVGALQKAIDMGLPESWYGTLYASGLSDKQRQRVKSEGLFASSPLKSVHRREPYPYLFDPIAGSRFDRYLQRNLKDID